MISMHHRKKKIKNNFPPKFSQSVVCGVRLIKKKTKFYYIVKTYWNNSLGIGGIVCVCVYRRIIKREKMGETFFVCFIKGRPIIREEEEVCQIPFHIFVKFTQSV